MQRINYLENYNRPIVLALGFFDCMHIGHMSLIDSARKLAQKKNAEVAIMTFANNHLQVLGKSTKLLYTFNERIEIYSAVNIDVVVSATFDQHFMSLTAQQYLDCLTVNKPIVGIVCGYDHYCGCDKKDFHFVRQYCNSNSIDCNIVDEIVLDNIKVSSTLVRQLLANNQLAVVNNLLSMPYHITGKVVHGRGVGHTIGFPTANLLIEQDKQLSVGVFSGHINIDCKIYKCIVNIGAAPTFGVQKQCVEVHIIGFNDDLYDRLITVFVDKFLRDIISFESVEELRMQLMHDIEEATSD